MDISKLKTILVITIGFTILGLITDLVWPYYVAATIGMASLISNRAIHLIDKIWYGLAYVLGYINSRILLTIIYYVFLFPLALLSRLSSNKSIVFKKNDSSYFSDRNHSYKKADLENPW